MPFTPPYDALLFDFDGVLVESVDVKADAFSELYRKYGPEIQRKVKAFHLQNIGMSRYEKFQYFQEKLLGKGKLSSEGEQILSYKFSQLVTAEVIIAPYVNGAIEFLEAYSSVIPCYVVTATPTTESIEINKARDMTKYFEGIYGSPKKKDAIINEILAEKLYNPEKVVMIGDSHTDLEAALSTGIQFIGRQTKYTFPSDITVLDNLEPLAKTLNMSFYEQPIA